MESLQQKFIALKASGKKIASLTAYDYPLARFLDEAGVDLILVGDSLGMVCLGQPDTTHVTLEDMIHHTQAAARGVKQALLVADLPAGSYDTTTQALLSASKLIEAGAKAVKLEGGKLFEDQIRTVVEAGIPVLSHIGMLPQSIHEEGAYRIKGKSPEEIEQLVEDALAVEKAGAFGVVIEIVTPEAARKITASLAIPTIGIGSGANCDGQILVTHDLLGLFPWFKPKFVTPKLDLASDIRKAIASYCAEVHEGSLLPDRKN
ncbi:MAG: 3-methyl-2-oxobutanoate hydroxymethyltransferase [Chthoniobacterales bacterium]